MESVYAHLQNCSFDSSFPWDTWEKDSVWLSEFKAVAHDKINIKLSEGCKHNVLQFFGTNF